MRDYDFKSLNDKEFEIFCADLLGDLLGVRFERFKRGKDRGVDGRYFSADGEEVILQCKHWSASPISELIRRLKKDELAKIHLLRPKKYILAVSNQLSRANKTAIKEALSPYMSSEENIFGNEDLNDLLSKRPAIENRHYKLWLSSSSVLSHIVNKPIFDRSRFSVDEIIRSARRYVQTTNHFAAVDLLEKLHVVIVTGEPGIGKTTLAEHLCLNYVAKGFDLIKIVDEIKEAESAFDTESPQIFYFDDFLGRNYLEALSGHEGSHIVQFIRRIVASKNKRFVLTSRSTILNQGKMLIDTFKHQGLDRNEFELRLSSLTNMDRARILYSHLWHSDLAADHVEEFYKNRRYRVIVTHKNFNPRLISFITDAGRLESIASDLYWDYVLQALENPADVWENPFVAQQDDFGRAIVLLVTLNRSSISEGELAAAYSRFISDPGNGSMSGRRDFISNLRHLTGSLLARHVFEKNKSSPALALFNPSLGDFVLRRYTSDIPTLRVAFSSLRSLSSLDTLVALNKNNMLLTQDMESVLQRILNQADSCEFSEYESEYLSKAAFHLANDCNGSEKHRSLLLSVSSFVSDQPVDSHFLYCASILHWAKVNGHITDAKLVDFINGACGNNPSREELGEIISLASCVDTSTPRHRHVEDTVRGAAISYLCDNIYDEFDPNDIFDGVDYGDTDSAEENLKVAIQDWASEVALSFSSYDVNELVSAYDIESHLHKYFRNSDHGFSPDDGFTHVSGDDEIDDLFSR